MKNLIKKILMEGDLDWASEGTDEGDGNHFISAMGKLEKMMELLVSMENDLGQVKNPMVKKLKLGQQWGVEPIPASHNAHRDRITFAAPAARRAADL